MKGDDEFPLMRGERGVRFGCGALVGILGGYELSVRLSAGKGGMVLLVLVVAVGAGILAALFGERFWRWLQWW